MLFQVSWLEKYRWFAYSPSSEGGLCKFCVLFPPKSGSINGTFVTSPFTNLKKAGGTKSQGHDSLKYHKESAARVQGFLTSFMNPETTIQHYISDQSRQTNLSILSTIVKAVILLLWKAKHCLTRSSGWLDIIRGNFIGLLHLRTIRVGW